MLTYIFWRGAGAAERAPLEMECPPKRWTVGSNPTLSVRYCNSYLVVFGFVLLDLSWRGGRAVECGGLENRCGFTATVGSNPTPSVL